MRHAHHQHRDPLILDPRHHAIIAAPKKRCPTRLSPRGRGRLSEAERGEGSNAVTETEAGMARMSERYRAEGSKLYLPAGE